MSQTEVDRLASLNMPPESPMTLIMGTILDPSPKNLKALAELFEQMIETMPLPDYVKVSGKNFVESLKRWSEEENKVKQVPVDLGTTIELRPDKEATNAGG